MMSLAPNMALALRRALDVESVPLERPPRRPGTSWLLNPRRLEIVLTAAAYPGIHLRSASRLLLSPLPSLRFHVRRLEDHGLLTTFRSEGRVHLVIPSMYPTAVEPFLAVWQDPNDRRVLQMVSENPGRTRSDLARKIPGHGPVLHRTIRRLVRFHAIRTTASRSNPKLRVTASWTRFEDLCEKETEKRLGRFLALLEGEGLSPSAEPIEGDRAKISVDGPRARVRFVLPMNPILAGRST